MKLGDCSQNQNNQNQNQQTETSQETSESIISWQIELLKAQDDNYINRCDTVNSLRKVLF